MFLVVLLLCRQWHCQTAMLSPEGMMMTMNMIPSSIRVLARPVHLQPLEQPRRLHQVNLLCHKVVLHRLCLHLVLPLCLIREPSQRTRMSCTHHLHLENLMIVRHPHPLRFRPINMLLHLFPTSMGHFSHLKKEARRRRRLLLHKRLSLR